jgi:3-isopropylmalate/(R)-2-methylmalate dehydratase large subunit
MGMTMTQKILAKHAGLASVAAGDLIECKLDMALGNDITAPIAIREFRRIGAAEVFDKGKIALVPDHFVPNKDIASAEQSKVMREFAHEMGIEHYFEVGCMGVEHALLPEKGLVVPGDCVLGADSHTCTYGALGAFSTGGGSTDLGSAMATGKIWFKVPAALRFNLTGKKRPYVSGKDVILHIIGLIGVDGARYMSMEFTGEGVAELTMDDRFSIANMGIEAGAKNAIFPVDEQTLAYVREHATREGEAYAADTDAVYEKTYDIDLGNVPLTVSFPHLPENAKSIGEAEAANVAVDQVVIGSCTNGRMEDMRVAAAILKGRKATPTVRLIIIPATQKVWLDCVNEGLMNIFVEAGAAVSTPTCGPCLGGYMGILAEGERAVATTNRNFVGRMGHPGSEVYLASPAVAAATAVKGTICGPEAL